MEAIVGVFPIQGPCCHWAPVPRFTSSVTESFVIAAFAYPTISLEYEATPMTAPPWCMRRSTPEIYLPHLSEQAEGRKRLRRVPWKSWMALSRARTMSTTRGDTANNLEGIHMNCRTDTPNNSCAYNRLDLCRLPRKHRSLSQSYIKCVR